MLLPNVPVALLCLLLAALWVAGGASREDVAGQMVVRLVAGLVLIVAVLFGPRPKWERIAPVGWLTLAALSLACVQLIPLPPGVWQALPGRGFFNQADVLAGSPASWRPLTLVPGATINAALSLIVPIAALWLIAATDRRQHDHLLNALLIAASCMALAGLLQMSGMRMSNPFVNDTIGQPSGMFANRNHFALFLAVGCLLAPVWAFRQQRRATWRAPVALGLVVLLVLTTLGAGSRVGVALSALALLLGLLLVWREIREASERLPRWAFPAIVAAVVLIVATFAITSIAADRAAAFDRLFAGGVGDDMRLRGLPTVLSIIATYFPAGTGLGSFDPIFRMHEPFALLKPTYFNHAHNDLLEVVLTAGLPGLLLIVAAVGWWVWASVRTWRRAGQGHMLPRLGSAILLLVLAASVFDYPARTPMFMAVIVLAGAWLAMPESDRLGSALPRRGQHL